MEVIGFLIGIGLCLLCGKMASSRGRWALGYFLLALLITPILTAIILLVVGKRFRGGYVVPDRGPYELAITKKQQSYLWNLGFRDEHLLDTLGRDQASNLIDQLRANGSANWAPVFALLIIGPIGGFVVYRIYQDNNPAPEPKNRPTKSSKTTELQSLQLPIVNTMTESEARAAAVSRYPSLAVANSPLNREFLARYESAKNEKSAIFLRQDWPLKMADEAAAALNQNSPEN